MIPKRRKAPRMRQEKSGPIWCRGHLAWVRGHECAIEGRWGEYLTTGGLVHRQHTCMGKIEAAHVRANTDGSLSVKPSDRYTIPLCTGAHTLQHNVGESRFEKMFAINMRAIADELWRNSPHRHKFERANQEGQS